MEDITEVVDIINTECPNIRNVHVWDNGKRDDIEPAIPCWHLYTYRQIKGEVCGLETVITPQALSRLTVKSVERTAKKMSKDFDARERELLARA